MKARKIASPRDYTDARDLSAHPPPSVSPFNRFHLSGCLTQALACAALLNAIYAAISNAPLRRLRTVEAQLAREQRALRASEEKYRGFVEQSSEGMLVTDEEGRIVEFNASLEQQSGIPRNEVIGQLLWEFQQRLSLPALRTPEHIARVERGLREILSTGESPILSRRIEVEFNRADGSRLIVLQTLFAIKTARGFRIGGISRDITDRQRVEQELRAREEQLSMVLSGSSDGFWDWDVVSGAVQFSLRWLEMLNYEPDEIVHHVTTWEQLIHPDDRPRVMRAIQKHLEDKSDRYESEHRLLTRAGAWVWVLDRGRIVRRDGAGRPVRMVGTHTDISERKRLEEMLQRQNATLLQTNAELEQMAVTDGLTGLRNRRAFQRDLAAAISHAQRTGHPLALVMVDVDHFKRFNDQFGHPEGDNVLQVVGARLSAVTRASDMVVRYGGEEFALILPGIDAAKAVEVAERCRMALLGHPWSLAPITASFGVASLDAWVTTAEDLLAAADSALYAAKAAGRNQVRRNGA